LSIAADIELDERHVIKNEMVALDRLRVRQNVLLVFPLICNNIYQLHVGSTEEKTEFTQK